MDIKQILPSNFTSYLSKNDVVCVTPPKLLAKLLAKFHSFVKRDKDGVPKLDLVKIDSFVNCVEKNRFNGEAW